MLTVAGLSQNPTALGMGGIHVLEYIRSWIPGVVQSSCAVPVYSFPKDSWRLFPLILLRKRVKV